MSSPRRRRCCRSVRVLARDEHGRRGVAAAVAAHREAQHAAVHADRAGAMRAGALGRQRHVTPAFARGAGRRKDHDWRMLRGKINLFGLIMEGTIYGERTCSWEFFLFSSLLPEESGELLPES